MPKTHPSYDSGFRQEAVNLLLKEPSVAGGVHGEGRAIKIDPFF